MNHLDELERLDKAATPGPWKAGVTYDHQRNAELIAAMRNALPKLLAVAKVLRWHTDLEHLEYCEYYNADGPCDCGKEILDRWEGREYIDEREQE